MTFENLILLGLIIFTVRTARDLYQTWRRDNETIAMATEEVAMIAARVAEQTAHGAGAGNKFDVAYRFAAMALEERGVMFDPAILRGLIEASVNTMFGKER